MKRFKLVICLLSLTLVLALGGNSIANDQEKYIVPGKVTLIDLGSHKCLPCRMMTPILNQLKREYENKAAIVFLDVWQDQEVAKVFGIRVIPTQVFFNEKGEEILRHEGFMDKQTIVDQLARMGVK